MSVSMQSECSHPLFDRGSLRVPGKMIMPTPGCWMPWSSRSSAALLASKCAWSSWREAASGNRWKRASTQEAGGFTSMSATRFTHFMQSLWSWWRWQEVWHCGTVECRIWPADREDSWWWPSFVGRHTVEHFLVGIVIMIDHWSTTLYCTHSEIKIYS